LIPLPPEKVKIALFSTIVLSGTCIDHERLTQNETDNGIIAKGDWFQNFRIFVDAIYH